ncbi:uncharacterized protein MELLADRAFT_67540 [Melampsora larici-populina 98AG31]|uniref:Secreted protein n=1 Tax=Melampsora larici-populina (strain 98AG31 / pathotype 3-4-7) TaxID=747676 RepID=F4S3H8_MELLP|nr:uncharacterized protein MELLADRAFT_67540 [Melampsora larici-populina 98AG31]EGG00815.1 hypothetical protein MELLADRAFT_67540 [Melampsora larici-populina 98AG31]
MISSTILLISLTQFLVLPVISVGFLDDQNTGEFFSDIFDLDPIIELDTPQPNSLLALDTIKSAKALDNLVYDDHSLLYGLGGIYPDHYHMPEFNWMNNILPNKEAGALTDKETTPPTIMQGSSILPSKDHLSTVGIVNDLDGTHQEQLIDSLEPSPPPFRAQKNSFAIEKSYISPRHRHLSNEASEKKSERMNQQEHIDHMLPSKNSLRVRKNSQKKDRSHSLINLDYQNEPKSKYESRENMKRRKNEAKCENYIYQNILKSILQWQCNLLLAKRYKVSEKIGRFFKDLQDSLTSKDKINDAFKSDGFRTIDDLCLAIEKIRTDFVMGVLGAFKILFQRHLKLELMESLILDLWEFLQIYLQEELSVLPEENVTKLSESQSGKNNNYIEPGKALDYALHLAKDSPISERFVHQKLKEWATTTSYKDSVPLFVPDYGSFIEECDIHYKQKGDEKTIYRVKGHKIDKAKDVQDAMGKHLASKTTGLIYTAQIVRFLKDVGSRAFRTGEVIHFFLHLQNDIKSITKTGMNAADHSKIFLDRIEVLRKDMVHKAVYTAQHELTAAFMGLLRVMYSEMQFDSTWDVIAHNGWEFLKEYFSTWSRYFSETNNPIVLAPVGRVRVSNEWSDLKATLNYFSKKRVVNTFSLGFIWFLIDLWHDETKFPESYGKGPPGFKVLPPHRRHIIQMCQKFKEENVGKL